MTAFSGVPRTIEEPPDKKAADNRETASGGLRRDLEDTGFLVARVFEKTGLLVTPPSRP